MRDILRSEEKSVKSIILMLEASCMCMYMCVYIYIFIYHILGISMKCLLQRGIFVG